MLLGLKKLFRWAALLLTAARTGQRRLRWARPPWCAAA
jgi:hypothetical protein